MSRDAFEEVSAWRSGPSECTTFGRAPDAVLVATLTLDGARECTSTPSRTRTESLVVGAGTQVATNGRSPARVDEPQLEAAPATGTLTWVPQDIKPNSDPNSLSIGRPGLVSVALLSTADLDTTTAVVQSSLRWGPTGTEAAVQRCGAPEDANGDGLLDLACKFQLADATFSA